MASVPEHYEQHLAAVYAWMHGGRRLALNAAGRHCRPSGSSAEGAFALDLGAGLGMHAVPLAQLGYSLIAVEGCERLLQLLGRARCATSDSNRTRGSARFGTHLPRSADLLLCMGDPLPHLPDPGAVQRLLSEVAAALAPNGRFVATFRDYCSRPLLGRARFIPVSSCAHRILTCFQEHDADRVQVHDLLHQLVDGVWAAQHQQLHQTSPGHTAG